MKKVGSQWLEDTAAEFDRQAIDPNERAELAEKKFRKEFTAEVNNTHDFRERWNHLNRELNKIHSFFLTQSNKDIGNIRSQFTGIFYFHGDFWEYDVPIVMGMRRVHGLKYLRMAVELLPVFMSDKDSLNEYSDIFFDSVDYGYGIQVIDKKCPDELSKELFRSGNKQLEASQGLLFQKRTNSKAIENARMAVEIFLKAAIVVKDGLSDEELRKRFGHHLDRLTDRCIALGMVDLSSIRDRIITLPEVQSRYEAKERTFGELWGAYRLALKVGATMLRELTGRDCRNISTSAN